MEQVSLIMLDFYKIILYTVNSDFIFKYIEIYGKHLKLISLFVYLITVP